MNAINPGDAGAKPTVIGSVSNAVGASGPKGLDAAKEAKDLGNIDRILNLNEGTKLTAGSISNFANLA